MDRLPIDIIHYIIYLTGKLYYWNGRYINKIDANDYRYSILRTIPKPIYYNNEIKIICIKRDFSFGIVLIHNVTSNNFVFSISKIINKKKYTLDKNNIWRHVIQYTM